jgi:phosphate/sulfate permease
VTYIKTSAVYVLIVLAALTGDPLVALSAGLLFGLVRGLAVFTSRGITTTSALASFHRRFMALDRPARATVVVVELAAVIALSWVVSPWLALASALVAAAVLATAATVRQSRRRRQRHPVPLATSPGGSRSARTA